MRIRKIIKRAVAVILCLIMTFDGQMVSVWAYKEDEIETDYFPALEYDTFGESLVLRNPVEEEKLEVVPDGELNNLSKEEIFDQKSQSGIPLYYGYGDGTCYDGGCYIYSVAMLLKDAGLNVTASNIYSVCGGVVMNWEAVSNTYNVSFSTHQLSGDYNSKLSQIDSLLNTYSGLVLQSSDHAVFAFKYNGEVRIHDPYHVSYQNVLPEQMFFNLTSFTSAVDCGSSAVIQTTASGKCGENLTWTITSDRTLRISGSGRMYDYTYGLETPWYEYVGENLDENGHIKPRYNFVIDSGITHIGDHAFENCENLKWTSIPDTVTSIGEYAFSNMFFGNSDSVNLLLPDSIVSIGAGAFEGTDYRGGNLRLPKSINTLESCAFDHNGFSGKLVIPDSVSIIKDCLQNELSISDIYIPNSVLNIDDDAFLISGWYPAFLGQLTATFHCVPGSYAYYWVQGRGGTVVDWNGIVDETGETKAYRITYFLNGGTNHPDNPGMYTEGRYVVLKNPARAGYIFEGWYTSSNFIEESRLTSGIVQGTGNITVYAKWSKIQETPISDMTYIAMSKLVYLHEIENPINRMNNMYGYDVDLGDSRCVKQLYTAKASKDTRENSSGTFKWTDIYEQELKGWRIKEIEQNSNGFFAALLVNLSEKKAVCVFRGSEDFSSDRKDDIYNDWVLNDIRFALLNEMTPQIKSAVQYAEKCSRWAEEQGYELSFTGHSLGGGLAIVAGCYQDKEAKTFNSAPTLDVTYYEDPITMGKNYHGIDAWKTVDTINEYDHLAGLLDCNSKKYSMRDNLIDVGYAVAHSLESIIAKKDGKYVLSEEVKYHGFDKNEWYEKDVNYIAMQVDMAKGTIFMGSTGDDIMSSGWWLPHTEVIYGGDGNDTIEAGNGEDYIIGGKGNDTLDGEAGTDEYYYFEGDGVDAIVDKSGESYVNLVDLKGSLTYERVGRYIQVKNNGNLILLIGESGYTLHLRTVDENGNVIQEKNIQSISNVKKNKVYKIACPVEVNVLDMEGTVLFTVPDLLMDYETTDFGSVYTYYDEEEGGIVKKITLDSDDYRLQIVALDDGEVKYTEKIYDEDSEEKIFEKSGIEIEEGDIIELDETDDIRLNHKNSEEEEIETVVVPEVTEIPATGIEINQKEATLQKDDKLQLTASLVQESDDDEIEIWQSDNPLVATVDENGLVTAKSAGYAKIYVAAKSGLSDFCAIKVEGQIDAPTLAWNCADFVHDGDKLRLSCLTDEADIYYTLDGSEPTAEDVLYDPETPIEITQDTVIKAMAAKEGFADSEVAEFNLTYYNPVLEIDELNEEGMICANEGTEQSLTLTSVPSIDSGTEITWKIDDENIATIDPDLKVQFKKKGYTTLSADYVCESEEIHFECNVLVYDDGFQAICGKNYVYTGSQIKPTIKVFDGNRLLKINRDYQVSYDKNINEGKGYVYVTGKGDYTKKETIEFTILQKPIGDGTVFDNAFAVTIADKQYNGKEQISKPTIKFGKMTLNENKDYTLSFEGDQVNPGEVTVIVNAKDGGNYTGSARVTYTIYEKGKGLSTAYVPAIVNQTYTGDVINLDDVPVVVKEARNSKTELVRGEDYDIVYANGAEKVNVGTANILIRGKGDYTGTKAVTFKIVPKKLTEDMISVSDAIYTGAQVKPSVSVTNGGAAVDSAQYTVSYSNNTKAASAAAGKSAPKVTVKGKGNFTGTATANFTIEPRGLSATELDITVPNIKDNGKEIKNSAVKPTVKYVNSTTGKTVTLKNGTDYDVVFNRTNTCLQTVDINLKGNYQNNGNIKAEFMIFGKVSGLNLNDFNVTAEDENLIYSGAKITPKITVKTTVDDREYTLVQGKDYTVSYSNNINAADTASASRKPTWKVTGKGAYNGSVSGTFTILKRPFTSEDYTVTAADVKYNKKDQKPKVAVIDNNTGKALKSSDYTLRYDSTKGGVAENAIVTVTGKGNYEGTLTGSFRVYETAISSAVFESLAKESYTGKPIKPSGDEVRIFADNKKTIPLTENEDYVLSYGVNTKAGKGTVTVTGIGKYGGSKTLNFTILPKWLQWLL